ncbi:ABC transporter permease, partial [Paraburkholderia sp. BR14262]
MRWFGAVGSSRDAAASRCRGDRTPAGGVGAALIAGEMRAHPLRTLIGILAIAAGVAMGYAVQLINRAALNELSATVNSLMGNADIELRGPRAGFDEALYPRIASLPEVAAVSPVVEVDARVAGRDESLKLLGVDVFRAGYVTPNLVGRVELADRTNGTHGTHGTNGTKASTLDLLDPDTVFLSPAALSWLALKPGDSLMVQVGLASVALRVAGVLPASGDAVRVGVMDIGAAQWRLQRLGTLERIDIKLKPGVDAEVFAHSLAPRLPAGVAAFTPGDNARRTSMLSRAYRANLNVLALVALFTGAFLVFTMQALAVLRRRAQFALLRAIGVTQRGVLWLVVTEGAILGVLGAAAGLAIGFALAAAVLRYAGGDLGGGYFEGVQPRVHFDAMPAAIFFALGMAASVLGSLAPALEAARARPARALKAGDEEAPAARLRTKRTVTAALLAIAAGLVTALLPPVAGLPVFGYLS